MQIKLLLKRQQGFTLIETMVNISVLLIIVTGTLNIFTIGFGNLVVTIDTITSMNSGRMIIEAVKNIPGDVIKNDIIETIKSLPEEKISYTGTELANFLRDKTGIEIEGLSLPDGVPLKDGTILAMSCYSSGYEYLLNVSLTISWQEFDIKLVTLVNP